MNRDDTLWKSILENVFDDFLRFCFKDANELFDLQRKFEYLDKELAQLFPAIESSSPKFVDKLVKVFTKTGEEEWILVHVEVQGYRDKEFARRMFTYFYRILDKYNKPVTAIAIFTGSKGYYQPDCYEYDYLGTRNTFRFNTCVIGNLNEDELMNSDNPFATVALTVLLALKRRKFNDDQLFSLKYAIAKNLLQKQFSRQKIDNLLIFLQLYVRFADKEQYPKFDQAIEVLTDNRDAMGIREFVLDRAKKSGVEEKTIEVVRNLLAANRFTITEIANFADVTEDYVLKLKKSR